MTINDHSVDICHSQIFQIAGGIVYIDLGMPVMQNSPSELLIFYRFDSGIPIPSSIPLLATWAATREIFSVGDASNRWLWRKATRLKWRRRQRYGYHCVAWWAASVGRFPLKKEDLKGIYSSLGDVFSEKKLPWSWNKHHKKWFWISTSSPKSGV